MSEDDAADYFGAYSEFAKTLRTWLVAYGIGVPVLILTQSSVLTALNQTHTLRRVGSLFLVGVAVQVAMAALNKQLMYGCYYDEVHEGETLRTRPLLALARAVSGWYWLDLLADAITLTLFGFGTYYCFGAIAK